jgi:beta-lactamase regulating signal transducer with metallopeptidase domain/uncharacterized protein YjbI with pentapeptide repeats
MALPDALQHAARIALVILINALWQGALIVLVTGLALTLFRRSNASTRYAVWLLALLAVLIIPVATSFSRVAVIRQTPEGNTHAVVRSSESGAKEAAAAFHVDSMRASRSSEAPSASRAQLLPAFPPLPSFPAVPALVAMALFGLWLVAAAVMLARLVRAFVVLEGFKRDSLPLSVEFRDAMPRWNAATKGERDIRICVSDHTEVPVAVGLFDAMILLPSHLVQTLDAEEVDQISLHELGHLLRADDWTNALQRIISGLLFFNPGVWFISRQLDVEREVACDDYVLQATGAVRAYASCLAKMAEMTAWPHSPLMAPGVFVTRKSISIRIERLLRTGRAIGSQVAPKVAGAVAIAMVAIFLLLNTLTPSVAFTVSAPQQLARAAPSPSAAPSSTAKPARAPKPVQKPAPVLPKPTYTPTPGSGYDIKVPSMDVYVPPIDVHVPGMSALGESSVDGMTPSGCEACDFSGQDLAGRNFHAKRFASTTFSRANLRRADFSSSVLVSVDLSHADLRGASFARAVMTNCDLSDAEMQGADFNGVRMINCTFDARSLSPEQAGQFLRACTVNCDFSGARLNGQDLSNLRLQNVDLSGADLHGTNDSHSVFTNVNLAGANLNGADLTNSKFVNVDFSHANLNAARTQGAAFINSDFGNSVPKR